MNDTAGIIVSSESFCQGALPIMSARLLTTHLPFLVISVAIAGCGPKQPDFPELSPVKGVVKKGKDSVSGGIVQFLPEASITSFSIASEVGTDGSYTLKTTRITDKTGESKPGAPAGKYKIVYLPTVPDKPPEKGALPPMPVELAAAVTIKAGDNDIPIDLTKSTQSHRVEAKGGGDPKKGGELKK